MNIKTYRGTRTKTPGSVETSVTVDGKPLNPRLDLWNHSPTGFEWGYCGSGPAQLALALLADHLGPAGEQFAIEWHQEFKRAIINALAEEWTLTSDQIDRVVRGFVRDLPPIEKNQRQ